MWQDEWVSAARVAFGRGLKERREGIGLSQRQLERRSMVDQTVISKLECGRVVRIRLATLFRVLHGLGVDRVVFLTERQVAAYAHDRHREPGEKI